MRRRSKHRATTEPNRQRAQAYLAEKCACGKVRYRTRADAKVALRRDYPGERMNVYECDGWLHIGHLPRDVVNGTMTRDDIWRQL